jgi:hypothetical protein
MTVSSTAEVICENCILLDLFPVNLFVDISYLYCDRFDGTLDMNVATQRPGTDFGATYATVFRIHGTEKYKSIATQCL